MGDAVAEQIQTPATPPPIPPAETPAAAPELPATNGNGSRDGTPTTNRAAFYAAMNGAKKPEAPKAPPAAAAPADAPAEGAKPDAAEVKPPEPVKVTIPKPTGKHPAAEYRIKLRELERERATEREKIAAERAEAARAAAEAKADREAAQREMQADRDAIQLAKRLVHLAQTAPDEHAALIAELSGMTTQDYLKRLADRKAYGPAADDAARGVAALQRDFDAKIEAERKARAELEAKIAREAEERAAGATKAEQAQRDELTARSVRQFVDTGKGLAAYAHPVLKRQAELLPHLAAMTSTDVGRERVEQDVAKLMDRAWKEVPGFSASHDELSQIARHLETKYGAEYKALSDMLGPKTPKPALPLGETERAPAGTTKSAESASTGGTTKRVDIAAAAPSAARTTPTDVERRRAYHEYLASKNSA